MPFYSTASDSTVLNIAQEKLNNGWLSPLFKKLNGLNFIVAGGAVRDTIFDKEVADIDIFYTSVIPNDVISYLSLEEVELSYSNTEFDITHEGMYCGTKVQLIKVIGMITQEVIATFPCSISQVFIKHNKLYSTPFFLKSFSNIVEWKLGAPENYFLKIRAKYPDMYHKLSPISGQEIQIKVKLKKYRILNSEAELYREFA